MTKIILLIGVFLAAWISFGNEQPAKTGGNLRYTISVSKFDNESGWSGQWDIEKAFTEIMTAALKTSDKFIVLDDTNIQRETTEAHNLSVQGEKKSNMDPITPAQLLVKGVVTHVENSPAGTVGRLETNEFRLNGSKGKAEVGATIYLINTITKQVKATTKVVGKTGKKGLNIVYSRSSFTGDIAEFKRDNTGKACENAVAQTVEFLVNQLENISWNGIIIKDGNEIIINRGGREGVTLGRIFTVGTIENILDDKTGEMLDKKIKQVGRIKVTKVKETISYCEAIKGKDKIEKNMIIIPSQ